MNCYYSNLIEGHSTHPIDIERALNNDYSENREQRDLQLEAKAHITVQRWIDGGGLSGNPVGTDSLREIHRRFCEMLPPDLLKVTDPTGRLTALVVPGAFRDTDVQVGMHIAISSGAVPKFLARFQEVYAPLGPFEAVLAAAGAHHRLLWIHPFTDGNGRVARLMSHATLLQVLNTGGVWSIARGLARNVGSYKKHLAECDWTRRNDLDGRSNLSEEALAAFARFFLETCIDQVAFMKQLMKPDELLARILMWTEEKIRLQELLPTSGKVIEALLYRGEITRVDAAGIVGSERQGRRVIRALLDQAVLTSEHKQSPLKLAFPASLASRWMPGLFPDQVE
jgi:Fic family protein